MIVHDSFNYHSLSLTIMFAIKRSVIVHDSLSKSRNVLASLKFQSSIISSYISIVVVIAKMFHKHGRASYSSIRLHIRLPLRFSLSVFFRFFHFSHFRAFSVTVVRIFVQIIALLFFTRRWQCGSHIALSPPWLPPLGHRLRFGENMAGRTPKSE